MVTHREHGQSVVELAMLLPILLLIVLGCVDLGRVFSVRMALANGAREGARIASRYPNGDPDREFGGDLTTLVEERTKEDILAQGLEVDASHLGIHVVPPKTLDRGMPITVTTEYTLPVFTVYLFGGKPIVIKASSSMAIIGGY